MSNSNNFNIEDPYVPSATNSPPAGTPNTPNTQMPPETDNAMFAPMSPPNPPVSSGLNIPQPPPPPVVSPVPPVPPPPPDNKPVNEFILPSNYSSGNKKISKFKLFVILGIVAIILIYGAVFYLYLQKKQSQNDAVSSEQPTTENQEASNLASEESAPEVPAFSKEFVKIVNGNVVYEDPNSGARVLVDKELFTSTGIAGFSKVSVSPDNTLLCFESWPPAPEPALFLANADGSSVVEVSPNRKSCNFTADSKKIFYESIPFEAADIFVYDINEKVENNLTEPIDETNTNSYSLVGPSEDGTKAICAYESIAAPKTTGKCEIDLNSFEVQVN